ncbi:MAG: hypothetical protein FRX49_01185 [Trebouxia sp. A1-2]|nr:MAG: hypothetical protein FRX49_01185 [Trebouxia sp. A1-2]
MHVICPVIRSFEEERRHDRASRCQKNTQRNEKATPFGIDFMRSKVLYQAAQGQASHVVHQSGTFSLKYLFTKEPRMVVKMRRQLSSDMSVIANRLKWRSRRLVMGLRPPPGGPMAATNWVRQTGQRMGEAVGVRSKGEAGGGGGGNRGAGLSRDYDITVKAREPGQVCRKDVKTCLPCQGVKGIV